ncbi:MAG: DNA polymerase IV [Firmicutes bacterium ADurb.Bin146]|nr:MAG: DNA polymerase IV [Firmicutes bacterium ADurb.Bin146]
MFVLYNIPEDRGIMESIILHADLNSFYASVECLYNPAIRDLPVAVCGSVENRHGIVLAKNQQAKKVGIKTGEAVWQARLKAANLVVVPPHYDRYLRFGNLAREIYCSYSQRVQPFGMDEAWIDISFPGRTIEQGYEIAQQIRKRIKFELGITVSIGVSFNKVFSKLGSDMKKPDAVTVISRENYKDLVWPLDVGELLYVGRATKKKLSNWNINTIGDLANADAVFIHDKLGKCGTILKDYATGNDYSPVENTEHETIIKSIGNSTTPPKDLCSLEDIRITSFVLAESVARRLREHGLKGKTVQIYMRDCDLEGFERQGQLSDYTNISTEIAHRAIKLVKANWYFQKPVRSFGIRVTDLASSKGPIQISIFKEENKRFKAMDLEYSIDSIRKRYGPYAIQRAALLNTRSCGDLSDSTEALMREVSFNTGEAR